MGHADDSLETMDLDCQATGAAEAAAGSHQTGAGISRRTFVAAAGVALGGAVLAHTGLLDLAASRLGGALGLGGASGLGTLMPMGPSTALATTFADCPADAWYVTGGYLDWVVENGLMTGYRGRNEFGPEDRITRAQLATVLFRRANPGSTATSDPASYGTISPFPDVPGGQFYTAAVTWAFENGIVSGYTGGPRAGNFGPDDYVTREQFVTMVWRYLESPGGTSNLSAYPDGSMVSDWAREAMGWATQVGVISGYGGTGELAPQDFATRSQAAKMLAVAFCGVPAGGTGTILDATGKKQIKLEGTLKHVGFTAEEWGMAYDIAFYVLVLDSPTKIMFDHPDGVMTEVFTEIQVGGSVERYSYDADGNKLPTIDPATLVNEIWEPYVGGHLVVSGPVVPGLTAHFYGKAAMTSAAKL